MQRPIPAAGEAMPKTKPTAEQVSDAMRELEQAVCDLNNMSVIAADLAERLFSSSEEAVGGRLSLILSKAETEAFLFAVNNVEARAKELRIQYGAAWIGRKVQ